MTSSRVIFGLLVLTAVALPTSASADFDVLLPMTPSGSGNYSISGRFGPGIEAEFLVDTGAGITVINRQLFRHLEQSRDLRPARRVAARLANGQLEVVSVYVVNNFMLGDRCTFDTIEVAVMPNEGRNILGMNTLSKAAPFGLHLAPPALAVTQCEGTAGTGAELAFAH